LNLLLDLLLAALLGALHSLPFVHTAWWPAQFVIIALLASRVAKAAPGRAALIGLSFGGAWIASGTWWLYISMHTYGGLSAGLAVAAVAVLSLALSSYLAAGFAAFAHWRSGRGKRDALLFGAVWLLAELARGMIFTGFPWVASGYAEVDSPLATLAPWVGVYGIGFVTAALASWPMLGRLRAAPLAVVVAGLAGLALVGPIKFTTPSSTLSVTLLQGNVPQDEKFEAAQIPQALAWTRTQLLVAHGQLVLGPETVIPVLPDQLDPGYWDEIAAHFRQGPQAALIGLPLGNDEIGYTNSAAGLSANTLALPGGYYRYDKHHLVPFGEFVPNGFHWFTQLMNIPLGDFNRGPVGPASFAFHGERIAPNICYEDLFGEELAARFADAANAPTIFANLSNIGWFGDSIAIAQHLQISRMRALEFQRPMLRATNTGATVVIDHTGEVTAKLAPLTQGVLDAEVQGRVGLTPYAVWASRLNLWPLWALGALIVAAAVLRRRRAAA
jgi:apolipoprotein N-acyltransferase